jgi:hypothetical protein
VDWALLAAWRNGSIGWLIGHFSWDIGKVLELNSYLTFLLETVKRIQLPGIRIICLAAFSKTFTSSIKTY